MSCSFCRATGASLSERVEFLFQDESMKECDQIPEIPFRICSHAQHLQGLGDSRESSPGLARGPCWDSSPVQAHEGDRLLRGIVQSVHYLNQNHLVVGRGAGVLVKMLIGAPL